MSRRPAPRAARPTAAAPKALQPPARSAACWRSRSATSQASSTRPDCNSAPTWPSAMANRICAASKERVRTDVSGVGGGHGFGGAARVSGCDCRSPRRSRSATKSGNPSRTRSLRRFPRRFRLAHRRPVHGEKRVDAAAVPPAVHGLRRVVDELLRARGVGERKSLLVARMKASLAWSAPVNPLVGMLGEHRVGLLAAAEPRVQIARTKSASAPPPARIAASASRSASGRSASHTAPWAAVTSRSGSGSRSESRLNAARRTTTRMSSRPSDSASSAATSPRSRRSRVDGARLLRTSP